MFLLSQLETSVQAEEALVTSLKSRQIISLLGKNNVCSVYKSPQPNH